MAEAERFWEGPQAEGAQVESCRNPTEACCWVRGCAAAATCLSTRAGKSGTLGKLDEGPRDALCYL